MLSSSSVQRSLMKIRSITYFCNPHFPVDEEVIRIAGEFLATAKAAYEAGGYEVQSTRLATVAFPILLGDWEVNLPSRLPELAVTMEQLIGEAGIRYASLGPALPEEPHRYEAIPDAIAATQNIFFGGVMADSVRGIDVAAVHACARVIVAAAPLDPNGFANLRFAALANVAPGSPFFPAAYHDGLAPAFAIATEAADLAVDAFADAVSVDAARMALAEAVEKHGNALATVAEEARSLGSAFERLGVPAVGLHGSLAAAAIIAEAIGRAQFPRTGFSGLMMPVLEDATLAKRAADGSLTVKDVLLYSAVCGTGLDTVPLPGDTTADQIAPLLLDVCALALRLDKPLTARLMPVPGKGVGDPTAFDFGFFANSKVM